MIQEPRSNACASVKHMKTSYRDSTASFFRHKKPEDTLPADCISGLLRPDQGTCQDPVDLFYKGFRVIIEEKMSTGEPFFNQRVF